MDHLEFEALIKHFEGALEAAEEQQLVEHLATCAACAADARKLASFPGFVNLGKDEQVPQATTAHLLNIYKRNTWPTKTESFARRFSAVLSFDDWQTALNERLIASESRQLLYRAASFDIDLRFDFAGDVCRVSGQVFPTPMLGTAQLFSESGGEKVSVNEFGEFVFPPIGIGNYSFEFNLDQVLIEIPDVSILS